MKIKPSIKKELTIFSVIILLIVSVFFFTRFNIIGFITLTKQTTYTNNLNLEIKQSQDYLWMPLNQGDIKSVKLSGSITKDGYARVYIENNNKRYLIFDSTKLNATISSPITANAILENETIIPAEPIINSTNQKTITPSLDYKTESNYDINNDGLEPTAGVIDLTLENTIFSWNIDQNKLCALYEIYSIEKDETNSLCYGAEQCCNLINLQSSSQNWNDIFYLYYTKYGASYNNIISSQIIYLDIEVTPSEIIYSEKTNKTANFYTDIIKFTDVCVDTCLVSDFNNTQYNLIIETNNTILVLDNIKYTIEKEEEVNHAPTLTNDIPNITIIKNEKATINISYYFNDEEKDILSYKLYEQENISSSIENNILTIKPDDDFTGVRYSFITANDSKLKTVSNIFRINVIEKLEEKKEETQQRVVIGKPVKWTKRITLETPQDTISLNLTSEATNISIRKIENNVPIEISKDNIKIKEELGLKSLRDYETETKIKEIQDKIAFESDPDTIRALQKELSKIRSPTLITGNVAKEKKEKKKKDKEIIIEEPAQEIEIEYYTEAPQLTETPITAYTKTIIVSSTTHYTDILAYINISPEFPDKSIKLYWIINNTKQLVNITKQDNNNNSLIDYIEWTVPSLSNQTYQLELTILNVQSYPTVGGNWIVAFTTSGTENLTITAVNGTTYGISEPDDLEFLNLKCNETILNSAFNGTSIFYPDYSCNDTGYHTVKVLTEGAHHQEFRFGDLVAYANNWAIGTAGEINFTSPTPDNNTITTNTSVQISINVTANITDFKFNWNGTNYSFYDNNLVLMYNFDNVSSLGENNSKVVDVGIGNNDNATCSGSGCPLFNLTGGKFAGAFEFNGSTNFSITNYNDFHSNATFSIQMWLKPYDNGTASGRAILDNFNYPSSRTKGYSLSIFSGSLQLIVGTNSFNGYTFLNPSISTNKWSLVTTTFNNGNILIYIDGQQTASGSHGANISYDASTNITIGGPILSSFESSEGFYSYPFNGTIDELAIYNRTLSADEARQHYFSNLKKYDVGKWNFYTNQSKNSSQGLSIGNYTYYGYAKDNNGNENFTETRILAVIGAPLNITFTPPTPDNNTITTNTSVQISINVTANITDFKWNWNGTNYSFYDSSLVLMMNFENLSVLGENASKVVDSSIYNINNGTIYGTPVYNYTSKYGGSYEFDGINDYINISHSQSINFIATSNFTLEAWIKPNDVQNVHRIFYKFNTAGSAQGYGMNIGSNPNLLRFVILNSDLEGPLIEASISAGNWYHVVGTFNGSDAKLYVNGELKVYDNAATTTIDNNKQLFIGSSSAGAGVFNGTIDEVRIYNRTLSADEARQHYFSNLKKYDAGKWNFYTNQSKNSSQGLDDGTYTYYGYAKDTAGDENTTETRQLTVDASFPSINFISPTDSNNSFLNRSFILVNVTATDTNLKNITIFLYNTSGLFNQTNSSISPFFVNFSSLIDGFYLLNATAYDTAGNQNSTETRNVTVDTTYPLILYAGGTENNGTFFNRNWIYVNVSITDNNQNATRFYLYNTSGLVNNTNYTDGTTYINFTSLNSNMVYYYNITHIDKANNANSTETRNITLDSTAPVILYAGGTADNGTYVNRNWIYINVSVTEVNFNNITFYLYNSTSIMNASNFTALTTNINFTNLNNDYYFYNVTVRDKASNINSTQTRNITLDSAAPSITLVSPSNNSGSSTGNTTFIYNATETNIVSNCSLIINYATNQTLNSITKNINQNFTINNTATGSYNWSVNCSDNVNNIGSSITRIITVALATSFTGGETTNFSNVNMSNITNLIIDKPSYGKINFSESVNLVGANLDVYVNISYNKIEINSSALPALNKSATLILKNLTFSNPRILRDSLVCPSTICTEISYSGNNLTFNVTQFSSYSAEETPTAAAVVSAEAGAALKSGGGCLKDSDCRPNQYCREYICYYNCYRDSDCSEGEACINHDCVKLFDVKIIRADSPIEPGEFLDFSYLIKGMADVRGDVVIEFWLEKEGRKIASGSDTIYIGSFEEKTEKANIFLPTDIPVGNYDFYVQLNYGNYKVKAHRVIQIGYDVPLFLEIGLSEPLSGRSDKPFEFSAILSFNKDAATRLYLEEKVRKDGEVIWSKEQDIEITKSREIKEKVGKLKAGKYQLELVGRYDNKESKFSESFVIEEAERPSIPLFKRLEKIIMYVFTAMLSISILVYITSIIHYKLKQRKPKIKKQKERKIEIKITSKKKIKIKPKKSKHNKLIIISLIVLISIILLAGAIYYFKYINQIKITNEIIKEKLSPKININPDRIIKYAVAVILCASLVVYLMSIVNYSLKHKKIMK